VVNTSTPSRVVAFLVFALRILFPVIVLAEDPPVLSPQAIPAPAPAPPVPPLFSGTAEFAFVATTGNSSTEAVGLSSDLAYRPHPWLLNAKGSFVQNRANNVVSAKSWTALVRLSRDYSPRLSGFTQYDYLRNLFAGIEQRHTTLGGISYKVIDASSQYLRLDGALGYANEQRLVGSALSTGTVVGGAAYKLKISPTSEISDEVRLVDSFTHVRDWRLDQTTALSAKINSIMSLKASYVVRYVQAPTPGFQSTDTISSITLAAKF